MVPSKNLTKDLMGINAVLFFFISGGSNVIGFSEKYKFDFCSDIPNDEKLKWFNAIKIRSKKNVFFRNIITISVTICWY